MIVIKREDRDTGALGVCDECGLPTRTRKVEVKASAFGGAGRGWYDLCFDCFRPRIFWRRDETDKTIYESPA